MRTSAAAIRSMPLSVLNSKLGSLTSLSTTAKTSLVAAINEIVGEILPIDMKGGLTSGNWNNCTTTMTFYYTSTNAPNWSNGPSSGAFCGIVIRLHANRILQIAFNGQAFYFRAIYSGEPYDWVALT